MTKMTPLLRAGLLFATDGLAEKRVMALVEDGPIEKVALIPTKTPS